MRVVNVVRPTDGMELQLRLCTGGLDCVLPPFSTPSRAFSGVGTFITEWEESAQRAMQAEPLYFRNWDRVKTTLLVVVSGVLAWQLVKKRKTLFD
ncbi:MAG: hypothetical protein EPN91_08535 [Salinibacterium sp.]|nr:MAG: hypothetical protein EPN91_08535 [Salinibacterium sp.]